MQTVHLRVNDARTGQPTPARLHVSGASGEYYAPFGRLVDFPISRNEDVGGHLYLGGKKYAYIDGSCEISLPTEAPLAFEIAKGPCFLPLQQTLTVGKGQMSLRFALEPWRNPLGEGWVSADARAHFLPPFGAVLERQAEGLDWVNLLACVQHAPSTDGHLYATIPNLLAFSGQSPGLEGVAVNTFNTHPALGRLALLNCHRPVYPLTFGGDDPDDWSLGDWCGQCHRKQGLVVWADAFRADMGLAGGEGLIALILGEIDAIEIDAQDRTPPLLPWWYRLLNAGFRIPLVGAGAKDSNRTPLGAMRTYTPPAATYREWIEHVRAGRTTAGNGPYVEIRYDPSTKQAAARAASLLPFDRLEIVANGEVIAEKLVDANPICEIECSVNLPEGGWIAARSRGAGKSALYPLQPTFAHTSAIDVPAPGDRRARLKPAFAALRRSVEETRSWIENEGRFAQARSKENLLERCQKALRVLDCEAELPTHG